MILHWVDRILFGLVLVFACLYLFHHAQIIFYPYQAEYREGAPALMTELLRNHKNPFSIEAFPAAMSVYGIFYHLVTWPFLAISGSAEYLLPIHRSVAAFFLFATLVLVFSINRRNGCALLLNAGLCLLFYSAFCTLGVCVATLLGQPGALGFFLMLLSVDLPLRFGFSKRSLLLSALLSVLCFFTKPYFIAGFLMIASYCFLFVSKKKSAWYALVFGASFIGTATIVARLLPLYFAETYYMAAANNSFLSERLASLRVFFSIPPWMAAQLTFFAVNYSALLICFALVVYFVIKGQAASVKAGQRRLFGIDWRLSQPLLTYPMDPLLYGALFGFSIFIVEMGESRGAWMQYLIQLSFPYLLLYVGKNAGYLPSVARTVVNVLVIANTAWLFHLSFNRPLASQATHDQDYWKYLDKLAATKENIFASPVMTSALLKYGKPVYVSGQSTFAYLIPRSEKDRPFLPAAVSKQMGAKLDEHKRTLLNGIEGKKFDALVFDDQDVALYAEALEALKGRYRQTSAFQIDMPITEQHWNMVIYEPIEAGGR